MRHFLSDQFGKFIYFSVPAGLPENAGGNTERAPEKSSDPHDFDERAKIRNVLMEKKGEVPYDHKKDLKENVQNLLWTSLKENMRDWVLDDTWPILVSHTAELAEILPKPGEEPDAEEHAAQAELESGQIIFKNAEGKELKRIDISAAFREAEYFQRRYQDRREIADRMAQRERARAEKGSDAYRRAVLHAALDIGIPGPVKPKTAPIKPTDVNEVIATTYVLDSLRNAEARKEDQLNYFDAAVQQKTETLDDAEHVWSKGFEMEIKLDPAIGEFSKDDWSAESFPALKDADKPREEGKWKDVTGHQAVENLMNEDPEHYSTVEYAEFLKTKEGDLAKLKPEIRSKITKNFKRDKAWFDERLKEIERAEKDERLQPDIGYIWDMRESVKAMASILNEYDSTRNHVVCRMNPFKENGWKVDTLREVVQGATVFNRNDTVSFDDIADELYAKDESFAAFKTLMKEKKVPDSVLDELKGKDLKGDYGRMKQLMVQTKGEPEKYAKAKLVFDYLGDYVVYGLRMIDLLRQLKYEPQKPLETTSAQTREGNIYQLQRNEKGDLLVDETTARARVALGEIFLEREDRPERYHTIGEHIGGWFSGEDTTCRVITMRDLDGKTLSIDQSWFTRGLSGETAFEQAYQASVEYRDGKEFIKETELKNTLVHYLNLGLSAYRMKPTDRLPDILKRNGLDQSTSFTTNIQKLYEKFQKELAKFFDDLAEYQKTHPNLTEEDLKEFFEKHKLSDDLQTFIQMGARMDYELPKESAENKATMLKYRYQMTPKQADQIIADIKSKTDKFSKEELDLIHERLTAGVLLAANGEGETAAGLGLAVPLQHGFALKFMMLVQNWDSFTIGGGVGKTFQATENLEITLEAGPGVNLNSGTVGAAADVIAAYKFEHAKLYAMVGASTSSMVFAGVGYEQRPEVYAKERIDRKLAEAHISGKDGLDNYSVEARYYKVKQDPAAYPEFAEAITSMEALGIVPECRPAVFQEFYEKYKEMMNAEGIKEQPNIPIILCTYRGIGFGGSVTNPLGFIIPIHFSIPGLADHLVFRLADAENMEHVSNVLTNEQIKAHYKNAKFVDRTISLNGRVIVDGNGRLALSREKSGALDIDPTRKWKNFQGKLEKNIDAEVGTPDNNGLIPIAFHRAFGETIVSVDPDMGDHVLVVTDGDQLFLSVNRKQPVYITREDITYPFLNEGGGTETTHITISKNPFVPRKGPGSVTDRSPFTMTKRRGNQWQTARNLEFSGKMPFVQMRTMAEFDSWLAQNPGQKNEHFNFESAELFKDATERMNRVTDVDPIETETLPANFEAALNELKNDKTFLNSFKENSTLGVRFERDGTVINPVDIASGRLKWQENLPAFLDLVKKGLASKGCTVETTDHLAVERALTELTIESFQNIWKGKKTPLEAYRFYLDWFEKPILTAMFKEHIGEKYPKLSPAEQGKKVDEMVNFIMAQIQNIDPVHDASHPLPENAVAFWTVGTKGEVEPETGTRMSYSRSPKGDPWGILGERTYDPSKEGAEGEIGRYVIERASKLDFPDVEKTENFHDILYRPLTLKMRHYAGAFLGVSEYIKLADVYEKAYNGTAIRDSQEKAALKKFLDVCSKVHEAELAGKKEFALEGTDWTVLIDNKALVGVYKKCTNVTGVFSEEIRMKEHFRDNVYATAGNHVVMVGETGFQESTFGLYPTPGYFVAAGGGGGGGKPVPGKNARILPVPEATGEAGAGGVRILHPEAGAGGVRILDVPAGAGAGAGGPRILPKVS